MKRIEELRVAVLCGGIGSERQVSLLSGQTIYQSLRTAGIQAALHDLNPQDLSILDNPSYEVFFLALHGRFGEDGQLQQILEQKHLAFTGSGSVASRTAFDKLAAKAVFEEAGLTVAKQIVVDDSANADELTTRLKRLASKVVIKPVCEGSSVGVEIHTDPQAAAAAAIRCRQRFDNCMIEEFIAGREMTVGLLNGKALPPIEIRPKKKFYDYHAKYEDDATEYLFDTVSDAAVIRRLQKGAETAFSALGCRHLGRVDFILTDDGAGYVLEMNTLPGFTSHSLLPMAARKAGIPTDQLCRQIAEAAWREKDKS